MNTNGVISFTTPVSTFTPLPFPLEGSLQLIAPYWADVDIRPSGSGNVWYRETSDPELIARARSDIMRDPLLFPEVDFSTFLPTSIFIATWDHVGYFNQNFDKVSIRVYLREIATVSYEHLFILWYVVIRIGKSFTDVNVLESAMKSGVLQPALFW